MNDDTLTKPRRLMFEMDRSLPDSEVMVLWEDNKIFPTRVITLSGSTARADYQNTLLDLQRRVGVDPDSEHTPTDLPVLLHHQ